MSMAGRVLYPETGFSTADLVDYYDAVAPVLLPHLAGRPLSLKRFPDDIEGEAFWEKDAPNFTPGWIQRFAVPRKHEDSIISYIGLKDARSLRWAASIGCIEIHPFLHRYPYIESPTLVAFDLDPGRGATVIDCCSVALEIRAWFERWRLKSFAKVSGSKGLQVYVPLNTATSYAVTQPLARKVAEELERAHPDRIVSRMARAERSGKVFIDWSQNADYKTTVSVYSVRAKSARPYVSIPLAWDEVEAAVAGRRVKDLFFSPQEAIARIEERGDLFAPVITRKQKIPAALYSEMRLPPATASSPVRVQDAHARAPALPRSSGQGGRKLIVVHRQGKRFELGIEYENSFFLFELPGIPMRKGQTVRGVHAGTRALDYLTEESSESGIVWDLGTYEVVEGSLARGEADLFFTGRRLSGEWRFSLQGSHCTMTNRNGQLLHELPSSASALNDMLHPVASARRMRRAS